MGRPLPAWPCSGWGLPSRQVALVAGALLPHRFTLACALGGPNAIGGLFSVALSCGSPRLTHVSTLPYGAPTFLDASPRRGHLADSPPPMSMHAFRAKRTRYRESHHSLMMGAPGLKTRAPATGNAPAATVISMGR